MPVKDPFADASIGDFERPLAPPPKAKVEGTAPAALDADESALAHAADDVKKELKPLERYEKALKDLKLTRDEAAVIVDTILMQGYWAKEMRLTPKRKIVLRSRMYKDTQRFHDFVEVTQPRNPSYYNEILYKYSLAASLEQYDTVKFDHPERDADEKMIAEAFRKRLAFVENLADPALRLCYTKLAEFDEIVSTVMQEGAVENF